MADVNSVAVQAGMEAVRYYQWPQELAVETFPMLLQPYLPLSNPLFNRIRAPHNTTDRHCLFAATFPPSPNPVSAPSDDHLYPTFLFADRSRHVESQVWIFNPLVRASDALTAIQSSRLSEHVRALLLFLRETPIPEAPGWPFSPIIRFAALHEALARVLIGTAQAMDAVVRMSEWQFFGIPISPAIPMLGEKDAVPSGFRLSSVPDDQLDIVLSTSLIPRQASTMRALPSAALLAAETGKLVAWAYLGVDQSFATLYVLPDYRGRGLARCVGAALLRGLRDGAYVHMGYDGASGWAHADIHDGNHGSVGVVSSLGGRDLGRSVYVSVDAGKI